MIVTRTFISPNFRGEGFVQRLMDEAVKLAEQENLQMFATCSYGIDYIENIEDNQ